MAMCFYGVKLIVPLISLALFTPPEAFSETVTLKSGKKIEGKILEKTDSYIKIDCDQGALYYEFKYVQSIDEDEKADDEEYLKKGLEYGSEAKFKEAEEEFKKGLQVYPSSYNLKEALAIIEKVNSGAMESKYAVYLCKGSNFLLGAQYKEAIQEFKEALELKPDDPELNYYLGVACYSSEEYDQALAYLEKAQSAEQKDEVYYYMGASYYSTGKFQEAINYMHKTLEIKPDDPDAYCIMGISNNLLGQTQKARDNLTKSEKLFRDKGDYLKAAEIAEFLNKLDN